MDTLFQGTGEGLKHKKIDGDLTQKQAKPAESISL